MMCDQHGMRKLQQDYLDHQPAGPLALGLNVIGYVHAATGFGESARSSLRAAASAGIQIAAIDVAVPGEADAYDSTGEVLGADPVFDINLFHLNPDHIVPALRTMKKSHAMRYNIGYWVWETQEWPDAWIPMTALVREVWTPSHFSKEAIQKKIDVPVTVIPHNVCPEVLSGKHRLFPRDNVVFLSMVDFYSTPERKNPVGSLEAFRRAFGSSRSGASLVLKINNMSHRPDVMKIIRRYVDEMPGVSLLEAPLDRPEVYALLNSCDCYVSLHRSEGFGLPIAEAMCLGKPVIATGWSGNMDFMDPHNSLPVRYKLFELDRDYLPYPRGSIWAEPDIDHAAELMRFVVAEREAVLSVGRKAAEDVRSRYSAEVVGEMMLARLREIVGNQS